MGVEPQKDQPKEMDWKTLGGTESSEANVGPAVKKRLPKRIRQVPEYYFLPRRSLPYSIAFYGSFIAAGVGAGMLLKHGSTRRGWRSHLGVRQVNDVFFSCLDCYRFCLKEFNEDE